MYANRVTVLTVKKVAYASRRFRGLSVRDEYESGERPRTTIGRVGLRGWDQQESDNAKEQKGMGAFTFAVL